MTSRLLVCTLLMLGLSACTGQAEFTSAIAEEAEYKGNKPKFTEKELERIKASWYLTDELIRAEKDLVAVHFPYFISANEMSKYIKPEDVYSTAWHYEGWSGSGTAFENDSANIYGEFFSAFADNVKEMETRNFQFLRNHREAIASENWDEIPEAEMNGFFQDSNSIENWKKIDLNTPIFYKFILKAKNEDILKLKSTHPNMKFSGTVYYKEHMDGIQKIIDANQEKYFFKEIPKEEIQSMILKAFEKSGLKK